MYHKACMLEIKGQPTMCYPPPVEQKRLGKTVKQFAVKQQCDGVTPHVVKKATQANFTQHSILQCYLMSDPKVLVEASPYDR